MSGAGVHEPRTDGLRYESVSCRFGSRRAAVTALRDFSLSCRPGEAVCLVGPNGAGKSSALALAAGLLPPAAGRVSFDDCPVSPSAPPRRLGYLPQVSVFPSRLSVADVLGLTAAARGAGDEAIRAAFCSAGFEPLRNRRVGSLSSGWLRRLGLAVALMPPADLLLLDEPFVGLDLETLDRLVHELERRVAQGAALLLCSHDFEVIDRLGARLAVLESGRLIDVAGCADMHARDVYRRAMTNVAPPSPSSSAGDSGSRERSGLHVVAR
ncbi:MAG: ABC transporter ATP-binding protein [Acidobacteriota bacterium]